MKPTIIFNSVRRIIEAFHIRRNILLLVIASGLVLAACSTSQPEISVDESSFTFGDVVNGQVVSKELTVRNNGSSPLVIEAVTTSCGCTTAVLDSMDISPGESAILRIEFDSGAHGPDSNGEVIRQIFIASNDPQQIELLIEFHANVLPGN